MEKQPDGTYAAEFQTTAEKFAYQLMGVAQMRYINGTQSDDFIYDGAGDYRSVVTPKDGKVRIIFDPKKLVRSEATAEVRFKDPGSTIARFALIYEEMRKRRRLFEKAQAAHAKAGKKVEEFSYDWSAELADLSKRIREEKAPVLRQALLLSYLELGSYGAKNSDPALTQQAFAEIAPTSPLWSIRPEVLISTTRANGLQSRYQRYIREVVTSHPDPEVRAFVKRQFDPNVAVGKIVPDFSLVSLDNSRETYSNASMKGKTYLIDFWAVWCAPCIAEMANLHEVYKKFRDKKFEILSLSLDDSPEDIVKFRQRKWKMPWLNAFIQGGINSEIAKRFEIVGIPKPILVDAEGRIIAIQEDLRGPNLTTTLTRILGGEQ